MSWKYEKPTSPGFYLAVGPRVELCFVHVFYDRPCDPLHASRFDAIAPIMRGAVPLSDWPSGCVWWGPVTPPDPVPAEIFERPDEVRRIASAGSFRGRRLAIDHAARVWRDASRVFGTSWMRLPADDAQLRRLVRGYVAARMRPEDVAAVSDDDPTPPTDGDRVA